MSSPDDEPRISQFSKLRRMDSNHHPSDSKSRILPLDYSGMGRCGQNRTVRVPLMRRAFPARDHSVKERTLPTTPSPENGNSARGHRSRATCRPLPLVPSAARAAPQAWRGATRNGHPLVPSAARAAPQAWRGATRNGHPLVPSAARAAPQAWRGATHNGHPLVPSAARAAPQAWRGEAHSERMRGPSAPQERAVTGNRTRISSVAHSGSTLELLPRYDGHGGRPEPRARIALALCLITNEVPRYLSFVGRAAGRDAPLQMGINRARWLRSREATYRPLAHRVRTSRGRRRRRPRTRPR